VQPDTDHAGLLQLTASRLTHLQI